MAWLTQNKLFVTSFFKAGVCRFSLQDVEESWWIKAICLRAFRRQALSCDCQDFFFHWQDGPLNWKDREGTCFSAYCSLDKIPGDYCRYCFCICVLNVFAVFCLLIHAAKWKWKPLKILNVLKNVHTGVRSGIIFTLGLGGLIFVSHQNAFGLYARTVVPSSFAG